MGNVYRVNVYSNRYEMDFVVSRVLYNEDLDNWDGRNYTNGGPGMHAGITKLRDGSYVKIIGSQWDGSMDYGYIVTNEEALQEILLAGKSDLLDKKKYKELKELLDKTMIPECIDEGEDLKQN